MLRNGVLVSQFTWSVIARILAKDGKFEKIGQVIDMGVCNSLMYNLMIEGYSKSGNFGACSDRLNEMVDKKLEPGFGTYSSILDGACQHKNVEMIEVMIDSMEKNGHILKLPLSEYDYIIQKLANVGKTYAAELFFKRAYGEKVELNDATYECMLRAFSREGRVKDAIMIHDKMLERGTIANCNCYTLFLNVLCKEDPTEKISELLIDIIGRGFFPSLSELSKFIISQSKNRRWREAEDLLNIILEKGFVPDPFCSSSLIKRYCSRRQIDSAINLHNKLEHLNGTLDTDAYNVLVRGLFKERRVEEALKIFDYMRTHNLLNGESFSAMISGLCHENDLKKAMKLHDEMLKMGLKPDLKNYKRLISGFR
ncbi:Pentatricopeptide repeat-containing protein [Heracleum sosnowskyi]|uniref:Pentatricopeptide repeat-containing protein n=1 Tax=Heracleum sosnowskyi TaxID=360622 RepID=A0AAD8HX85_9APIA|nr:Pentatricopeptide repeat-containing protein [Heracleum sosnowskyi]